MPELTFTHFSNHAKEVLIRSVKVAIELHDQHVQPEYILYSLMRQKGSIGSILLAKTAMRDSILDHDLIKRAGAKSELPVLSSTSVALVEKAAVLANAHRHQYVGTEHLLLALLDSDTPKIKHIFTEHNIQTEQLKQHLKTIFGSINKFQDFMSSFQGGAHTSPDQVLPQQKKSVLEGFTTDLTNPLTQKTIDPVIGREDEISRLIEILMRRTKNNPLILGDPGVGKTAIVEGLAKRIMLGQVPEFLLDKRILSLDLGLLVAGTMFRGEFESRLKQIMEEVKRDPNIIIFIDEIHNIIGAGSTQGSMDVANILKPALARGEVRCIGATTYEEYKKYIESDAALERRFQLVKVTEPTPEQTIAILEGIKENYELYHNVHITTEALEAAATLSAKYISDRHLPDKAIDLIDEAASKLKISQKASGLSIKLKEEERRLREVVMLKQKAIMEENFKKAITLKVKEKELIQTIEQLKLVLKAKNISPRHRVGRKEICQVLSRITGIPLAEIEAEERQRLLRLEEVLRARVVGQDEAVSAVAQALRRAKSGIREPHRPLGSFLFIGPSGTGKTHLAKVLAQEFFQDKDALIKIDMSEFSEKFNISKLIGAPAGYVGYKESGKLTDAVKRRPYSIVLFDEVEKAHPDIFNLLLQILDEGTVSDATGKRIDFRNTIIIMTSNLGAEKLHSVIGFGREQHNAVAELEGEVRRFFRPEFINRLDGIIVFSPLNRDHLQAILHMELEALRQRLQAQGTALEIGSDVYGFILARVTELDKGARMLKKKVEELIETPLADTMLRSKKKAVRLSIDQDQLIIA